MIEYLYDAIRANAGEDIIISVEITDEEGECVTETCGLMLHDDNGLIVKAKGSLVDGIWNFAIPKEATANLQGRYWYCICKEENNKSLCFKQPIYLR